MKLNRSAGYKILQEYCKKFIFCGILFLGEQRIEKGGEMRKEHVFIILTALIFSTLELTGKIIGGQLNAFQVTFIRFTIGALILIPFAIRDIKEKKIYFNAKDFLFLTIEGILCIPVSMALLQLSVYYTKASTAAVVFCINPVFTIPFAYFILKEKINKQTIYSMIVSLLGVIVIFNPLKLSYDIKGMIIALIAAVTFSLYSVLSKKHIKKYGGYVFNCFSFILGSIVLFIILLIFKNPILKGITVRNLSILIYMGIVITGIGYILFLYTIEKTSAVSASAVFLLKPAIAPMLAFIFIKEHIAVNGFIGIILIIFGSYIGFKAKVKIE